MKTWILRLDQRFITFFLEKNKSFGMGTSKKTDRNRLLIFASLPAILYLWFIGYGLRWIGEKQS
jgi:hypothetical protein